MARYPATPWLAPSPALDRTQEFLAAWDANAPVPRAATAVVLTPGLYAEWLPDCFGGARRAFEADGHRVLRNAVRSSRSIASQAAFLESEILQWLRGEERFLWMAHSKGAIDALWCLHSSAALRERCAGFVAAQPAVGNSWVMEAWLMKDGRRSPRSFADRVMGAMLAMPFVRDGSRDCTSDRDPRISAWLDVFMPEVPTLHVVSWSVVPTSRVDSFHSRLSALRPGCAHDGQFYLPDQLLRETPLVCLPRLDHAQPVLGGHGLDVARLWRTLLQLVHTR